MAVHVPIEMVYDADVDGVYEALVPASRIRQVWTDYGFKGIRAYVSDAARAGVEIVNADGVYTADTSLRAGVWAKLRVEGTHELLYTGRIESVAVVYRREQPYTTVTLSTSRGDLRVPPEAVLLKNTNVKAAVQALLAEVPLASFGGYWLLGYSALDIDAKLFGSGAGGGPGSVDAWTRFFGSTWTALAAAGGYGVTSGELDVLEALTELMKAEDGRAVWGRDNVLESYSQTWLDAARAGTPTLTLTDSEIVSAAFERGTYYANEVQITWYPRRWQADTTLWTLDPDDPISLAPTASKTWNVRFKHDDSDRVVAAEDLTVEVTSSDTLYQEWVGEVRATGGELKLTNYTGSSVDITHIRIGGRALIGLDEAVETQRNEYDVSRFGLRSYGLDCTLLDAQALAAARAAREFAQWNTNRVTCTRVELRPRTSADALAWMLLPFGTLLRVNSTRMAHDETYLLIGSDMALAEGMTQADITLYLEQVVS